MKKDLPPLTEVISDRGGTAETEFKRLVEKLLIRQSILHKFEFEHKKTYKAIGIDGIVRENYLHKIICPVIFHIRWLSGELNEDATTQQMKNLFYRISNSKITFKSFILITPKDLTKREWEWLCKLSEKYKIEVYYYGHTIIHELLNDHPPLKKYYYGEYLEEVSQNFHKVSKKYRDSIIAQIKHLEFIGLPTGQYQKQDLLKKPELKKVYIPLEFYKEKNSRERLSLSEITKKSNRFVILGDPGTGKSTLAKYLALSDSINSNREVETKSKIPFIIPVRDFVRVKQSKSGILNFFDYLKYIAENNYGFDEVGVDFFKAKIDLGEAIVLFDGLDEIASEIGRIKIAREIEMFCSICPDTAIWITSRIVGYTPEVTFDSKTFVHYYLAPVSSVQANNFIESWYTIQFPQNKDIRIERIKSLQFAVNENPGVQGLKTNPLLLTMMTLVHQFEGTLPDDRARLYEKCIELLLKTWQDQKYSTLGQKNPLEERGLNHDEQMRLLAAAAFHIQNKNQDTQDEDTRGLIEEEELSEVLFEARFDNKRMSKESAKVDIKIFLNYIRDRTGLFVEKGRNEKGDNIFAFVHLSFLEYLCAYQIAEDKSKAQRQHIQQLLTYFGKSAWEEIILLSLYIFSKSTGRTSFIDEFCGSAFKKQKENNDPNGWFLLGRAIRDNIGFATSDIKDIITQVIKFLINDKYKNTAFSILKEIYDFSKNRGTYIKMIIGEIMKHSTADTAFWFLYLHKQFHEIDSQTLEEISNNKNKFNLFPYLPIYRNDKCLDKYINENLREEHWAIYYNSAKDRTIENLDKILNYQLNEYELKGYLISSWSTIFSIFQNRSRFLEINKSSSKDGDGFENIVFDFGYTRVVYPLRLFRPFMNTCKDITLKKITNDFFTSQEKLNEFKVTDEYLIFWVNKALLDAFSVIKENLSTGNNFSKIEVEYIREKCLDFSKKFYRNFSLDLSQVFKQYLIGDKSRDYRMDLFNDLKRDSSRYLRQHFCDYLSQDFTRYFGRDLIRNFSKYLNRNFSQYLARYFSSYFCRGSIKDFIINFILYLCQDFSHILDPDFNQEGIRNFKDLISDLFQKENKKKLVWDELPESKENQNIVYHLFRNEFNKKNIEFIEQFYNHLYDYLFYYRFKISFEQYNSISQSSKEESGIIKKHFLSVKNPFMIPFTFNFILIRALDHYIINLLADLNTKYKGKDKITDLMISKAVDNYCHKRPFTFYYLNYSWDFYCKDFYEKYNRDDKLNHLRLAALIINAAKVSLVVGVPCVGEIWDNVLEEAEKSKSSFVQISLTLHKLCSFENREKNSELLDSQLEKFRDYFPEYYKLIGFTEK